MGTGSAVPEATRRGGRALLARGWRRRTAALLGAGLIIGGAACAPTGTATTTPAGSGSGSAPSSAPPALRATPLTLDEMRARKGHLGFDVRQQPVVDPEQFDPGRMRLACGATVELPVRAPDDLRVYRSSLVVLVEAMAGGVAGPEAVVAAAGADRRDGCAPVATTWSGQAVTATLDGALEVTVASGSAVGWSESWVTASGGERYRYAVVAGAGDRLTVLDLVVDIRLDAAQVRSLFDLALAP